MTRLILIRHGQTDWNKDGRWQGQTDIPLNETGIMQADAVARRLASTPVDVLYTSDLQRAAKTASFIADQLGLQAISDPVWRERDFGEFEGLTKAEVAEQFPFEYERMRQGIISPPGGEDDEALQNRVAGAFERIVQQHQEQTVTVVTHGGVMVKLIGYVLGIPDIEHGRLSLRGNTGINIIEIHGQRRRVVVLNDTAHLEPWAFTLSPKRF